MEFLIPIIAVLAIFGSPVLIVRTVLEHRRKMRELDVGGRSGDAGAVKELAGMREERKLLQARIENLETIVCSVDYELNAKIGRLLGAPAPSSAPEQSGAGPGPTASESNSDNPPATSTPRPTPTPGPTPTPTTSPSLERTATIAVTPATVAAAARSDVNPGELERGRVIANRYKIERLLGRGGMGAVYLAHDEVLGELVALKVIASAWASDPTEMIVRFRREASAARKVSSPNVIRIHDLGEATGGLLYLSMEYFAARTLAQVMSARGLVPLAEARDILDQVCVGLAAAHDVGVIHRDIKPGNILVGERNTVKLIDFGLAKATAVSNMTATGMILGTPHYMSPEQVRGRPVDARSDVYSLGALAFHVLTGRPPFAGDNAIAIGFAHCMEDPPSARTLRTDLGAQLGAIIKQCMAKKPEDRPSSVAAVRKALA
jgi:hypothetical protein